MLGCPGCGSIEQDGTNDNVKQGRVGAGGAVATAFKETGSPPHPPPTSPEPRPSLPLPTIPIPAHHPCSPSPPPPCSSVAPQRGLSESSGRLLPAALGGSSSHSAQSRSPSLDLHPAKGRQGVNIFAAHQNLRYPQGVYCSANAPLLRGNHANRTLLRA